MKYTKNKRLSSSLITHVAGKKKITVNRSNQRQEKQSCIFNELLFTCKFQKRKGQQRTRNKCASSSNAKPYACLTYTSKQFIHLVVCLTRGPKPLPKRVLHIVRSRASSSKWEYPLLFLSSSSSFLRLLPRLPVISIPPPFIFPSITCCRRQFRRKM